MGADGPPGLRRNRPALLAHRRHSRRGVAAPLHHDQIRAAVVAVVKPRLIEHQELLGPLHDSNDTLTFREQHGRRLLVRDLMQSAVAGEIRPPPPDFV